MSFSTYFSHPERAPYELGYLLRSLPRHLHGADLSDDQCGMAEAAANHASICATTLLTGLEAIGRVMWSAALNKQQPVDAGDFGDVGQLVTQIAVQLQFLNEFRGEVEENTARCALTGDVK